MIESIVFRYYDSPLGRMKLGSYGGRLCLCSWCDDCNFSDAEKGVGRRLGTDWSEGSSSATERAAAALDVFFAGKGIVGDIPLLMPGTDFQRRVWFGLSFIPYGSTVSYGSVSRFVTGGVSATRAVASAIADNPVCVFVPCHRVVGVNGKLTGYAGGIAVKEGLLALECGSRGLF